VRNRMIVIDVIIRDARKPRTWGNWLEYTLSSEETDGKSGERRALQERWALFINGKEKVCRCVSRAFWFDTTKTHFSENSLRTWLESLSSNLSML
jgi:hypothetical protein